MDLCGFRGEFCAEDGAFCGELMAEAIVDGVCTNEFGLVTEVGALEYKVMAGLVMGLVLEGKLVLGKVAVVGVPDGLPR